MQEHLIQHFFSEGYPGSYKDVSVQIIDYCDPNNKEVREKFWIDTLNTWIPNGLNSKSIEIGFTKS